MPGAAAALPVADAQLLRLLDEARAADAALDAACAAGGLAETARDPAALRLAEAAEQAASARYNRAIAAMAATPAEGWQGIAAKAARLCASVSARRGRILAHAEHPLADSLAADLARLVPEARA
jgi:hypothetical protein